MQVRAVLPGLAAPEADTPSPVTTPAIVTPAAEDVAAAGETATIIPTPRKWSGIESTLAAAGWPEYLWTWAEAIIWRESREQPWAVNVSSGAAGWFQIMPSTWAEMGCWGDPLDAFDNAVCAWRLYQVAGESPWAVG